MNDIEAHTELPTAILADTSRIVIPALIVTPTHVNDFTLELLQLISSYFAITSHFRICMPLVGGISISRTYHSHTLNVWHSLSVVLTARGVIAAAEQR